MGSMDGVSGLEADHLLPALLREELPQFVGLVVVAGERTWVGLVDEERNLAAEERVALTVQGGHAWMLAVCGAVDLEGLALLVVGVAVLDDHGGDDLPFARRKRYLLALAYLSRLVFGDGERDGHAPRQAVGEAHTVDDALVVIADHKTRERREDACGDHLQVRERPRAYRDPAQPLGLPCSLLALVLRRSSVYERPAVRDAGRVLDINVHPFTSGKPHHLGRGACAAHVRRGPIRSDSRDARPRPRASALRSSRG